MIWLGKLLTGDFGISIFFCRPVGGLIAQALPATIELVACGLVLGIAAGVLGGLAMFAWRGHAGEQVLDLGSTALMAIPEFLWAILLILLLGVGLPLLPFIGRLSPALTLPPPLTGFLILDSLIAGRFDALRSIAAHMVLPSLALAIGLAPLVMRVLRSSPLDTILEDYIMQARLRGLSERRVLVRHALRNAALPTISLIGVQGGFMFGGTVLVEMIFAYPGLGNLMVDAVRNDRAVVRYLCSRVLVMQGGEVVEAGETAAIFAAPRHPCTRALLAAVPPNDLDRPWPPGAAEAVA